MKISSLLINIIIIVILTGCYTTNHFIPIKLEIIEPAYYSPSPDSRNAAVMYNNSNYALDSISSQFEFNNTLLIDTVNHDSIASIVYYESFLNSLRKKTYFDTVIDIGRFYPDIESDKLKILSQPQCDSLKKIYNCDIIYSLDHYIINDITLIGSNFEINSTANNSKFLIMYVITKTYWSIYDLMANKEAKTLLKNDTIKFSIKYNSKSTLKNMLIERPEYLNEASFDAGADFSKVLVPHWEEVERLYYKSGNVQLKLADEYVNNYEWLKAANIWKNNINNKNKNIAAKSMFNLAIACEIEGNLDAAVDWAVKSFYVFEQKNQEHSLNCMDYIQILSQRKIDFKILEKQF